MTGRRRPDRAVVAVFGDRVPAELARSLLAANDIRSALLVDDAGGVHPELSGMTGGVRLAVASDDAERARALLAEDRSADLDDADWQDGGDR